MTVSRKKLPKIDYFYARSFFGKDFACLGGSRDLHFGENRSFLAFLDLEWLVTINFVDIDSKEINDPAAGQYE